MKYISLVFLALICHLSFQDAEACTGTDVQLDITAVSCNGSNTGSIKVLNTFISDHLPYTYSLNGGAFTSNNEFYNLTAGSYTLVVRNSLNCDYTYPDPVVINEPDPLTVNALSTGITCGKDAKAYAEINGGIGPYLYSWNTSPPSAIDTLRNIGEGTYEVTITDQNGCTQTASTTVNAGTSFSVTANPGDTRIKIGEVITLSAAVAGGGTNIAYQWLPEKGLSCSACAETEAQLYETTQFIVVANDLVNGCSASDTLTVTVEGVFTLFIPNAFSPNGDRKNEQFLVYGVGVDLATVEIFDTNGFQVYSGPAFDSGWDGTVNGNPAREGIYFYSADITYIDGSLKSEKGQIVLIR